MWKCNLLSFLTYRKTRNATIVGFANFPSKGVFTWHRGDFRPGASSLRFPLMALYLFTWYHHKVGASHPGVSAPRFLYRGENFTPVWNLAAVSCKRETTTRFRSAGGLERLAHAQFSSIQDGVHVGHGITEVKQISVKGKGRRRHRKLHRLSGFAFLQYLSRLFNL